MSMHGEPDEEFEPVDASEPYRRKGSLMAEVLHADAEMIVVNKPPMVSLLAAFEGEPSVELQLRRTGHLDEDGFVSSLFHLDATLSGLAVFARSEATLDTLRSQIDSGDLTLTALALIRARVSGTSGRIDIPLQPHSRGDDLLVAQSSGEIRAVTAWRVRDTFVGFALLECLPDSAKPNQVRAHLSAAGMPLVVDPRMGGGESLMLSSFKAGYRPSRRRAEHALIDRPTLHVFRLVFEHPTTRQPLSFEADFPKDFRAALHQLDRFGRLPAK